MLLIVLAISKGMKTVIMIAAMIAVFYFFLIRPQSQQAKKEAEYRNGLQKGDRVMTAGGIHVTVVSVNGNMAQVEIAPGHRIKIQTSSLQPIPKEKR